MMRQTLRVDLEEGQVLDQIGAGNLFETVEAAVSACVGRMQAADAWPGTPQAPDPAAGGFPEPRRDSAAGPAPDAPAG
jgi:hypothetical protein